MANEANNQAQPAIMIRNQYIKDMSLEIPFAPAIFKEVNENQPEIHVDMGMKSDVQEDGSYVVSLETKMDADINGKKLFILELTYCSNLTLNIPEEHKEPILMIELPRLMFPFVRSIVATSLANAGLPPLMLNPIDFAAMYQDKKAKEAAEAEKGENK
jgi:preprotein translocase subunit SecB